MAAEDGEDDVGILNEASRSNPAGADDVDDDGSAPGQLLTAWGARWPGDR